MKNNELREIENILNDDRYIVQLGQIKHHFQSCFRPELMIGGRQSFFKINEVKEDGKKVKVSLILALNNKQGDDGETFTLNEEAKLESLMPILSIKK